MREHVTILYQDKICRKLLKPDERDNLRIIFQKGANCKIRGYMGPVPGKPDHVRIFAENCVLTCKKIDPNKGPFW
jgi:hypothetical protein